jgi:hypothetical protein
MMETPIGQMVFLENTLVSCSDKHGMYQKLRGSAPQDLR